MKTNPVFKRETMVTVRSFRLALTLLLFNGVLALVALLNMYSTLAQVRLTAEIQYGSFMDLYLFVAVLEFVMLIFIMPAISAGSISGERERQTLDLMLTTQMTPADIVLGKLAASLSTMFLLIISSLPILAMVFVYGGVTMNDLLMLLLCLAAAGLFVGSLGMCCSALFQKSTLATVVTYALMGTVVFGTYGVNVFIRYMSGAPVSGRLSVSGWAAVMSDSPMQYLLLVNPASTFLASMTRLTSSTAVKGAVYAAESAKINLIHTHWIMTSIGVQFVLAAVMVWLAIRAVSVKR